MFINKTLVNKDFYSSEINQHIKMVSEVFIVSKMIRKYKEVTNIQSTNSRVLRKLVFSI